MSLITAPRSPRRSPATRPHRPAHDVVPAPPDDRAGVVRERWLRTGTEIVFVTLAVGAVAAAGAAGALTMPTAWLASYLGAVVLGLVLLPARSGLCPRAFDEFRTRLVVTLVPGAILVAVTAWPGWARGLLQVASVDPASMGVLAMAASIAAVAAGWVGARLVRRARRIDRPANRVVVVGTGETARLLAEQLGPSQAAGLRLIGHVDVDLHASRLDTDDAVSRPELLGHLADLPHLLARHRAGRLVVALPRCEDAMALPVLRRCRDAGTRMYVVPRLHELGLGWRDRACDEVGGIPVVELRAPAPARFSWRAKRGMDLVAAGIGLLLAAPVMAVIAAAIRCTSPGPVLFRQQRIGRHGHRFELLKFRSMALDHDGERTWRAAGSPEVTAVGRVIRSSSLDELPQLFNVLRGEMSLVGPRPERPAFVDRFSAHVDGYEQRHRLPVGLTGWAQVNGLRGDTSIDRRARFDNAYVDRWSLSFDLLVIARTVRVLLDDVFRRREA